MPTRTKFQLGDRVWVNARAPLGYPEREGTVFDRAPGRGGYGVRFDDGAVYPDGSRCPSEGYLDSEWLDTAGEDPLVDV
jgi:hypothetical protein